MRVRGSRRGVVEVRDRPAQAARSASPGSPARRGRADWSTDASSAPVNGERHPAARRPARRPRRTSPLSASVRRGRCCTSRAVMRSPMPLKRSMSSPNPIGSSCVRFLELRRTRRRRSARTGCRRPARSARVAPELQQRLVVRRREVEAARIDHAGDAQPIELGEELSRAGQVVGVGRLRQRGRTTPTVRRSRSCSQPVGRAVSRRARAVVVGGSASRCDVERLAAPSASAARPIERAASHTGLFGAAASTSLGRRPTAAPRTAARVQPPATTSQAPGRACAAAAQARHRLGNRARRRSS